MTPARRALIDPFHVMEVVAAAAEQEARTGDVLHLEVGQPSTGAPSAALEVAVELLRSGAALGYTPACGLPMLRRRIAELYADRYGVEVDAERVVVTAGASAAVVLSLLAAFDAGARIVVTEPGYPCYRQMMAALGVEVVPVRTGPGERFRLRPDALDARLAEGPIDGVLIASPANPTGTVHSAEEIAAIQAWCDRNGATLVVDEIYHGITFDRPATTAVPDAIVIGSFSKYHSMTGWRLGWAVLPEGLVDAVDRLSQNLYLSPPTLAQHVAIAALDHTTELDRHVERYATNRALLSSALERIGVTDLAPSDGAFYLYGNVSHWGIDSRDLVRRWLTEIGVATAPGIDFDPVDGGDWVRWSVAGSTADIAEAARRLVAWASAEEPARG